MTLLAASSADETKGPGDWRQFRGPGGQGHVNVPIPTEWGDSQNKVWEVAIPGKGWSSPVVDAGKVWMTTAVTKKEGGASLRAIGVDEQTGKLLHDIELFAVSKSVVLHPRNTLATPTPVIDNGRLFASFGGDGVACIDAKSGSILWKNDTLKVDYETGAASSPIVYKDLLILPCDGSDQQFAVALKTADGEIAWKTDRPQALSKGKQSRRAFATPLVITVDGKDQVVIPGSHCVYSYDPLSGKELWRASYGGFSNVPRPVFAHGLVFVTTGFAPPDLIAIRPDGTGDVTKTHIVWRQRKNVPNVPSPIVVGDHLYMVSDPGTLTCLDAKTGSAKWTERLGSTFSASLLAKDNTIYAFADDGKTILIEAAETFKELRRNELPGKVQATPAAVPNHLYIRTDQKLVKIGVGK